MNSSNPQAQIGENYLQLIAEYLRQHTCQVFGYNALFYTPLAKSLVGEHSTIKHQVTINRSKGGVDLVGCFEELPIASDSIDLVVMPFVLQNSENPHQILREVERVLIPEGTVIIIGRNPFCWRGALVRYRQWRFQRESNKRDIRRGRIADWFRLLGFETEAMINISATNQSIQNGHFYPWIKRTSQLVCEMFGSYYVIVGRKKVSTLTPIRQSWRRNKQLVPSRFAEPGVTTQVENLVNHLVQHSKLPPR